jgi:Mg2+ and Co2+ transporter CorA
MPAGSIVVELLAKTGSFETDINRATKAAEKRMRDFSTAFKASFAGNILADVTQRIAADIGRIPTAIIDSLDRLNDLADATGDSVENLSALEDIGARTGTAFESVSAALVKFNQSLKEAKPDSDIARVLSDIGLKADDLKRMEPSQALLTTAKALDTFGASGEKARAIQELFGRSVREVAPFLKDLAEKGELVATVTTEQAQQAEEFNKQLFAMQKNSSDLSRAIMSDLLPALNQWATVLKEGGILAFLGLGGPQADNPGKALDEIGGKLRKLREDRDALDPSKSTRNKVNEFLFGDVADIDRQIKVLEAEQRALRALQSNQALSGLGDTSDALSRRLGTGKRNLTLTAKAEKGPKGPDPDADFKAYLNNLQQQIQKTQELTLSEKLLDDIRRGALTVTPQQEKQLKALAGQIDAEKSALAIAKERQALRNKEYEDAEEFLNKTDAETRQRLDSLLGAGPQAQLERQRADLQFLADQVGKTITPEQFSDAATGMLGLNQQVQEGLPVWEQFASIGTDALHALTLGGEDADKVFQRLLLSVADLVFQIGVVEPLMEQLRTSMKKSSTGGGIWESIFGAVAGAFGGGGVTPPNPFYGGAMAAGGDVLPGRSYLVGENGPETFVPRTAGAVLPNSEGAGKEAWTVINQTTGRVDRATEFRLSAKERALLLQESIGANAVALGNPNSALSQNLKRNYNVRQHRP